jgi:hypothetical protein
MGLGRSWIGDPVGLHQTSALYVESGWSAQLINLLPGLILASFAISGIRTPFDWRKAWVLFGAVVGSVMIASPLLSTQYMSWITPFAAFRRSWAFLMLLINSLSLVLVLFFDSALLGEISWFVLAVLRNVGFLALVVALTREVASVRIARPAGRLSTDN